MGTKTGIYKQKCSISCFLFIFEGKSARKMKMTGYYQFSQALSVAMPESSIVITISGVEPARGALTIRAVAAIMAKKIDAKLPGRRDASV
ncbi:MAG: hypothetical protein IJM24_09225 [Clostridia bacterium]|nr:hypothetical protein [Clostridia bacterium]